MPLGRLGARCFLSSANAWGECRIVECDTVFREEAEHGVLAKRIWRGEYRLHGGSDEQQQRCGAEG